MRPQAVVRLGPPSLCDPLRGRFCPLARVMGSVPRLTGGHGCATFPVLLDIRSACVGRAETMWRESVGHDLRLAWIPGRPCGPKTVCVPTPEAHRRGKKHRRAASRASLRPPDWRAVAGGTARTSPLVENAVFSRRSVFCQKAQLEVVFAN